MAERIVAVPVGDTMGRPLHPTTPINVLDLIDLHVPTTGEVAASLYDLHNLQRSGAHYVHQQPREQFRGELLPRRVKRVTFTADLNMAHPSHSKITCTKCGAAGVKLKDYQPKLYQAKPIIDHKREWHVDIVVRRPRYTCRGRDEADNSIVDRNGKEWEPHTFIVNPKESMEKGHGLTQALALELRSQAAAIGALRTSYNFAVATDTVMRLSRSDRSTEIPRGDVLAIDTKQAGGTHMLTAALYSGEGVLYPDVIYFRGDDDDTTDLPTLTEPVRLLLSRVSGVAWVALDFADDLREAVTAVDPRLKLIIDPFHLHRDMGNMVKSDLARYRQRLNNSAKRALRPLTRPFYDGPPKDRQAAKEWESACAAVDVTLGHLAGLMNDKMSLYGAPDASQASLILNRSILRARRAASKIPRTRRAGKRLPAHRLGVRELEEVLTARREDILNYWQKPIGTNLVESRHARIKKIFLDTRGCGERTLNERLNFDFGHDRRYAPSVR